MGYANTRLESAILRAYKAIGRATPLKADCGILCGAACCKDTREEKAGGDFTETDFSGFDPSEVNLPRFDLFEAGVSGSDPSEVGVSGSYPTEGGVSGSAPSEADMYGSYPSETDVSGSDPDDDEPHEVDTSGMLGMLLFPGEAGLLSQEPGFRLFRILYMGVRVWFLVCEGTCDRRKRPLSCRVFPLAPHIGEGGVIRALPDPRAMRVCPLAGGERLEPSFRRAVAGAFRILAREPETYEFMRLLSEDLSEMRKFIRYFI